MKSLLKKVIAWEKSLAPKYAGAVRGVALAVAISLIGLAVDQLGNVHAGPLAYLAPLGVAALRSIEGMLDQKSSQP